MTEAADRLDKTLDDVLLLAYWEEIPICLHTDQTPVTKVVPYNHIGGHKDNISWERTDNRYLESDSNILIRDIDTEYFFSGPYQLELNFSNSKKWLLHLRHETGVTSFVDNGVILRDKDDEYWIVDKTRSHRDILKKDTNSIFSSRTDFPSIEELVIKSEDIERYKKAPKMPSLDSRAKNTDRKIIDTLMELIETGIPDSESTDEIIGPLNIKPTKLVKAIASHSGVSTSTIYRRFSE